MIKHFSDSSINDYKKALKILTKNGKFHIKLGLDRVKFILEKFNNPEKSLKVVHVAGTNGKGSVCSILANILKYANKKVGLYTSPHIIDYTERLKINGIDIPKEKFAEYIFKVNKKSLDYNIHLTEFEILTIAMYLYFRDENVDIAIVETGLGGRFDATNVINNPMISVITSISIDHKDRLGDTIDKIAYEKSGIIKGNSFVVISKSNLGYNVIKEQAKLKSAYLEESDYNIDLLFNDNKNYIILNGKKYLFNLIGLWQKENLELVFKTLDILKYRFNYNIEEEALIKGLSTVKWPCRMEKKGDNIIFDGAHNVDAAKKLKESIEKYYPDKKIIWVYGCINTKEYEKILDILMDSNLYSIYFYNFEYENAVNPLILQDISKTKDNIINQEGLDLLMRNLSKDQLLVVCGSFYMLGSLAQKGNK